MLLEVNTKFPRMVNSFSKISFNKDNSKRIDVERVL